MTPVPLEDPTDFTAWRAAARALRGAGLAPDQVVWTAQPVTGMAEPPAPFATPAGDFLVPKAFVDLAQAVICHRAPTRHHLLYRLLWRIRDEPGLLDLAHDAEVAEALHMAADVARACHRIRAFLRFDQVAEDPPAYAAWFEPKHPILRRVAPFFAARFGARPFLIQTPDGSARWDGATLRFGNTLPAPTIPAPTAQSPISLMPNAAPSASSLADLPALIDACRRCPLYKDATQGVPGEGPAQAKLMLVGEQPGDQEDLAGKPFVGPAGQVLDRALSQAGVPRGEIYVTNAVRHFKHELRGKRRLHKTPGAAEVAACRWWLDEERRLIRPRLILAMGGTAVLSVFGKAMPIGKNRGQVFQLDDQAQAMITVHPSYLLRLPDPAAKKEAYAKFVEDLAAAWGRVDN